MKPEGRLGRVHLGLAGFSEEVMLAEGCLGVRRKPDEESYTHSFTSIADQNGEFYSDSFSLIRQASSQARLLTCFVFPRWG